MDRLAEHLDKNEVGGGGGRVCVCGVGTRHGRLMERGRQVG